MDQVADNPITEMAEAEAPEASLVEPESSADDDLLARLDAAEDDIGVMLEDAAGDDPVGDGVEDPEPKEDDSSDQEEDREQPEPIDGDEMEKALSALRRDGLPADVIEKMTNQEVIDLGVKRAKVQADTDNAYRELRELQESSKQNDAVKSDQDSEAAEPTEQPVLANLDEAVKPFADLFGDDGAEALKAIQQAAIAPLMGQIRGITNALGEYAAKDARRELADQFPQLSDDQAYGQVEERMGKLIKSGSYSSPRELMADAARLTFADDQRDAAKAYRDKTSKMRSNGQMSSTSKQPAPASMSYEDREDMVLELLEGGGSRADARRAFDGSNQ